MLAQVLCILFYRQKLKSTNNSTNQQIETHINTKFYKLYPNVHTGGRICVRVCVCVHVCVRWCLINCVSWSLRQRQDGKIVRNAVTILYSGQHLIDNKVAYVINDSKHGYLHPSFVDKQSNLHDKDWLTLPLSTADNLYKMRSDIKAGFCPAFISYLLKLLYKSSDRRI